MKKLLTAILAISMLASYAAISFPASAAETYEEPSSVQLTEDTAIESSEANLTIGNFENIGYSCF